MLVLSDLLCSCPLDRQLLLYVARKFALFVKTFIGVALCKDLSSAKKVQPRVCGHTKGRMHTRAHVYEAQASYRFSFSRIQILQGR